MDYQVEWSPEALDDVDAIAEYIARDSEIYAQSVVAKILAVSRSLNQNPLRGRMVPELENEEVRERFIYSYRLIYRVRDKQVLIIAVMHGKQMLVEAVGGRMHEQN